MIKVSGKGWKLARDQNIGTMMHNAYQGQQLSTLIHLQDNTQLYTNTKSD